MSGKKKRSILGFLTIAILGAVALLGSQWVMKETNKTEFCVSCHSMEQPKLEWEGSSHFANQYGVRAECSDCHVPQEGLHYLKAKVTALKDVWHTVVTGKLDTEEAYEQHRLEMAQRVWDDMKATDSATCKTCHSVEAMETFKQSEMAQQMHSSMQANNQTCIDCHKGLVHFMPEVPAKTAAVTNNNTNTESTTNANMPLYVSSMANAKSQNGAEVRLMPYATLNQWQETQGNVTALLQGWQQVGAESLVYQELGKRINVAVLDDEAKVAVKVLNTVHDDVTDSEWKAIELQVVVPKSATTTDLNSLNAFGNNLNQTYCSGCHAVITAEHYTANQWVGVINSMKNRTSMNAEQVRALTIYLQRNAKDMNQ